jgi:hypothetical protein
MPRRHLTAALLAKPVSMLSANELKRWRDSLIGGELEDSSINRMLKCLRTALKLAARHDPRITNADAWKTGLESLPDATNDRNVILADKQVSGFVRAAYAHDGALGLYVDTLAVSGARPSQASRLLVADRSGAGRERGTEERRLCHRWQAEWLAQHPRAVDAGHEHLFADVAIESRRQAIDAIVGARGDQRL